MTISESDFMIEVILAPIAALLIPILWNLASIPIAWIREFFMKKPTPVQIDVSLKKHLPELQNAKFKCLIIRYGTDQYIESMANDQEKYDGRLRNQIIEASFVDDTLKFTIPLHKRIGTQFKCFFEVESKEAAEKIVSMNDQFEEIYDLSASSSQHRNRVFFLVKDYGETKTVDGLTNNMLYPI